MFKNLLAIVSLVGVVGVASAADNVLYTATATPGTSPDGTDQNSNPLQVWNVVNTAGTGTGSAQGAYFGTAFSGETLSGWEIWTSPGSTANAAGVSGNVDATHTFAGGALLVGQTVSLNYEMRGTSVGTQVGISLLNGSGAAITLGIYGGEPSAGNPYPGNGYYYTDAGSTFTSAGSMGYQYQTEFNIAFTVTGADTYSAVAGSDSWSGTFNGSLTGIDVFNYSAGNASDDAFNNLDVVPEPGTIALVGLGLAALLAGSRGRFMNVLRS
jgi:PEP-CTERM motif